MKVETLEINQNATKHLDLGCGNNPRNLYDQKLLYGIDIGIYTGKQNITYVQCNVIFSKLPFEENTFDSVSAFDFIEHIPREIFINGDTTFPFIHVMNEIHRVLKPNGKFYALTPAFPNEDAFVDPTHVNIITKNTHKYFTEPHNWAIMYGFTGKFGVIRAKWVYFRNETEKRKKLYYFLRNIIFILSRNLTKHFLWEFKALK